MLITSAVTENNTVSTLPRAVEGGSGDLQKDMEVKKGFLEEDTCWQRGEYA